MEQWIKSGDNQRRFEIELKTQNNQDLNDISYIRLTHDFNEFIEIKEFSLNENVINFTIPDLQAGYYHVEIMDVDGYIYPAHPKDNVTIKISKSLEGGKAAYMMNHKNEIIQTITSNINDYINDNPDDFKGEKGDKGSRGERGFTGRDGEQGQPGTVDFDSLTAQQMEMLTPILELEENGNLYYKVREND